MAWLNNVTLVFLEESSGCKQWDIAFNDIEMSFLPPSTFTRLLAEQAYI